MTLNHQMLVLMLLVLLSFFRALFSLRLSNVVCWCRHGSTLALVVIMAEYLSLALPDPGGAPHLEGDFLNSLSFIVFFFFNKALLECLREDVCLMDVALALAVVVAEYVSRAARLRGDCTCSCGGCNFSWAFRFSSSSGWRRG